MVQVSIVRKSDEKTVWVQGGYQTATRAEHDAEVQIIMAGLNEENYEIKVESI